MKKFLFLAVSMTLLLVHVVQGQEQLQVDGAVTVGDSKVDSTAATGTVRYNPRTEDFEGYDGRRWKSLTKENGNQWGQTPIMTSNPNAKVVAPDTSEYADFGGAVAIDGNYAVVGCTGNDSVANRGGAAYIYERVGNTWELRQMIFASDPEDFDAFGDAVDMDGDYIIVGAPRNDDNGSASGSAYIFIRSGSTWTQQAKLTAPDGAKADEFGSSVAIDNTSAIIGTPGDQDDGEFTGSVYVFVRSGTFWSGQAKLLSPNLDSAEFFGFSVDISGDYTIIGAPGNDTLGPFTGAAYTFNRIGTTWNFDQQLWSNLTDSIDFYGYEVAIDSNLAFVGSVIAIYNGLDSVGAIYVYEHNGTAWTESSIIGSPNTQKGQLFGFSISLSNGYLVAGESGKILNTGLSAGSAHVFHQFGESWGHQGELTFDDPMQYDDFGITVGISGGHIIIGAPGKDVNGLLSAGAIYFFQQN